MGGFPDIFRMFWGWLSAVPTVSTPVHLCLDASDETAASLEASDDTALTLAADVEEC